MGPNVIDLQYIAESLSEEERLCMLAEEAAELAQAALKLRRCYDGSNPCRVHEHRAVDNLKEEIADVWLSLKVMGLDDSVFIAEYQQTMARKAKRWANDLENAEG